MVIAITSGKGGTGKTTAASAISACLAARGKKTLCIDMDFALPNLDLALGIKELSVFDIFDVAQGYCELAQAIKSHPDIDNLYLLSGPGGERRLELTEDHVKKVINEAKKDYDYCIIDTPAGMGDGFYYGAKFADEIIVITTLDATSLRDSQRIVMELDEAGAEDIRLIVNRVRPTIFRRTMSKVDDLIDFVGLPLLGLIPDDNDVLLASAKSVPLILMSGRKASKAFLRIARRIMGEQIPMKYR